MKKLRQNIFGMALLLAVSPMAMAQTESSTEQPKGKPIVTLFGDAGVNFTDEGETAMGFNLERAYLGYQYDFNSEWRVKAVYDMGKGDDTSLQRLGYIKNAEVDFKKKNFSLNMGLTSTAQFGVQEKFWGQRYVYKSLMDDRKWGSSADLGFLASYRFADAISADISVFNGEGYKKIQADDQLLYGLGLTINPLKGLTLRAYTDIKTAKDTVNQQNIAVFAGYKCKAFRLGAEYEIQFNQGNGEDHDLQALSIYGACRIKDNMEIYARYDINESRAKDEWEYTHDGQIAILGFHYQVNKLFSFSPNVRFNQAADYHNKSIYACVSAKVSL